MFFLPSIVGLGEQLLDRFYPSCKVQQIAMEEVEQAEDAVGGNGCHLLMRQLQNSFEFLGLWSELSTTVPPVP